MVRQARNYLAGAVSGTAMIVAAVVGFVLLVSLQTLREWPLAGVGFGEDSNPAAEGSPSVGAARKAGARPNGAAAGRRNVPAAGKGSKAGPGGSGGAGRTESLARAPGSSTPNEAGSGGGSTPQGSGGSTGQGSSGGGSQSGSGGGQRPSAETAAGTVNDTVSGVDQATGGALGATGVTQTTEEAVNGAAGPESTVGQTVDSTTETVGGAVGHTTETVGGVLEGGR